MVRVEVVRGELVFRARPTVMSAAERQIGTGLETGRTSGRTCGRTDGRTIRTTFAMSRKSRRNREREQEVTSKAGRQLTIRNVRICPVFATPKPDRDQWNFELAKDLAGRVRAAGVQASDGRATIGEVGGRETLPIRECSDTPQFGKQTPGRLAEFPFSSANQHRLSPNRLDEITPQRLVEFCQGFAK